MSPKDKRAPTEGQRAPLCAGKRRYGEETYRGSGRLEGRAAIITGGESGIGRAVALAFAREGADVLISYLDEEPTPTRRRASSMWPEAGRLRCLATSEMSPTARP